MRQTLLAALWVWLALAIGVHGQSGTGLSVADRLDDCIGPRADFLAFDNWRSLECQADKSCAPFDRTLYPGIGVSACLEEAMSLCALGPRSGLAGCIEDLSAYVDAEIARIQSTYPVYRAQAARENTNAWHERRWTHLLAEFEDWPDRGCWLDVAASWPYANVQTAAACSLLDRFTRLTQYKTVEDLILNWENFNR